MYWWLMNPGGTHQEAVEAVLLVQALEAVEDAAHHIVSAGGLSAGQDDADVERLLYACGVLVTLEFHHGHSVGVGETRLDLFLVCYGFRRLTELELDGALEGLGQLRLIFSTYSLKCTLFHEFYFTFVCIVNLLMSGFQTANLTKKPHIINNSAGNVG